MRQAVAGLITELEQYETRSAQYADALIPRSKNGKQQIDKDSALCRATTGFPARLTRQPRLGIQPSIQESLACSTQSCEGSSAIYYSEFVGIHDDYDRYNQFTEREILPRLAAGPDAFYGADGKRIPMFRMHMDLQTEFAANLRRMSQMAHDLRISLEPLRNPR